MLVILYLSIIEWRKGTAAQKRALFEQFIAYCAKVGAKPAFNLMEWSFDEVPTLGKEAWEAKSFADVYGMTLYWGRRLFCQKTAVQRHTMLASLTESSYYEWWLKSLRTEQNELGCLTAGDSEPYNSAENWLDAFQDETCLSLGDKISRACAAAVASGSFPVDLMMPFGSGTDKALQHSFGPLSASTGLQCNNFYRYPESVPPKLPPHFQWANQISYSHVAPTKVPVTSVLNTWTPQEWHAGWTTDPKNRPILNQRMIYTASFADLQAVVAALGGA